MNKHHKSSNKTITVNINTVQYQLWPTVSGFTLYVLPLHPSNLGDRCANLANNYGIYRVKKLKTKIIAPQWVEQQDTNFAFTLATAYTGTFDLASNPGGFDSMAQFPGFGIGTTYHPPQMSIGYSVLRGQESNKWWITTNAGPPSTEDRIQGYLYFAIYSAFTPATSARMWFHITGTIEFGQELESSDLVDHPLIDRPIAFKTVRDLSDSKDDDGAGSTVVLSDGESDVAPVGVKLSPAVIDQHVIAVRKKQPRKP